MNKKRTKTTKKKSRRAGGRFITWLDLPHSRLNPNVKPTSVGAAHAKRTRVAAYREHAAERTSLVLFGKHPVPVPDCHRDRLVQLRRGFNGRFPMWEFAAVKYTFFFPRQQGKLPDRGNLAAAMKAAEDGFVDAGLLKDDNALVHHPIRRVKLTDEEIGCVKVEVWEVSPS